MELARSKEDAAQDVLAGRNLLYYVYFPLRNPIPTLFELWFNNEKRCSGPKGDYRTWKTKRRMSYMFEEIEEKS